MSFTLDLSVTEKLKQDFAHLTNEERRLVLENIISVKSKQTGEVGVWHMPAELVVSNENGISAPTPIRVDILKGI